MAVDRERVAELYRAEGAHLRRSLSGVADPHRAEDVLHDAFITYLTNGDRVEHPTAWLARVARNRALNEHRRPRTVALTDRAADDGEPGQRLERRALGAVVVEALGQLDERSRRALVLRFYEERDYTAVADELDISVSQAHVVMHRAARRLGRAIVRRLAASHGAIECASALERMAGISSADGEHAPDPCRRCAPAWDEIAALRLPALVPVGLVVTVRRMLNALSARAPSFVEPATAAATVALAAGLALFPARAPEPLATRTVSQTIDVPSRAAVRDERVSPPPGDRTAPAAPGVREPRVPSDDEPPDVVEAPGGTRLSEEDDHVQGEAGGDTPAWSGIVACEPFEPCPPPPE